MTIMLTTALVISVMLNFAQFNSYKVLNEAYTKLKDADTDVKALVLAADNLAKKYGKLIKKENKNV